MRRRVSVLCDTIRSVDSLFRRIARDSKRKIKEPNDVKKQVETSEGGWMQRRMKNGETAIERTML